MGEDFTLTATGKTLKATGTVNKIDSWPEFSNTPEQQSGHYLPLELPAKYLNQKVTIGGINSKKSVTLKDDTILITRMEHISDKKTFTLTFTDGLIVTVDASGVTQK